MKKKLWLGAGLALMLATTLAGCSGNKQAATKDKELNVTMSAELETADPNRNADAYSAQMLTQTTEGLYRLDKSGKIVPGMAKEVVKPTDNGKVYTFHLRKAKWSNGDSVTADDFVNSFDRQVTPATKSQYPQRFQFFKNYAEVQSGKANPKKLGVKALDKHTLQVTLSKPQPTFNFDAATEYLPVNTKLVKKYGKNYGSSSEKTAANGPYVLKNWDVTKDTWQYEKNDNYYGKKSVKMPKVNVQVVKTPSTAQNMFQAGKVDETMVSGMTVKQDESGEYKKNLVKTLKTNIELLQFNSKDKLTGNRDFRLATSYALDRDQIANKVLQDGSKGMLNMVSTGLAKNPKTGKDFAEDVGNLVPYDTAKAKQYWNKFLKENGNKQYSLTILANDSDTSKNVAEYVQAQWQKLFKNLKVSVQAMPLQQQISKMNNQNFDVSMFGWTGDEPDPTTDLQLAQTSNSINFTHWKDSQYESLMNKVNDTEKYSGMKRYNLMKQADTRLMKVMGLTPLYQQAEVHLVSSKVGGLSYTPFTEAQYRYAYWK